MPSDPLNKPSFSAARKWGIGLQVLVLSCLVLSVVAMANYISRDYFYRLQVSARNKTELSPLTLSLLKSLTNQVRITLYYDKKDPIYDLIYPLLQQYEQNSKHVSVQVVDYLLDAGTAQKVKEQYNLGANTNIIVFDCAGTAQPIPGSMLADYQYEALADKTFRQKFTDFRGEKAFTAAILAVTDPKAHHAYVLQGHGEHDLTSGNAEDGYLRFTEVLGLYHIEVHRLDNLMALEGVPTNCDLLIIPGSRNPIPPAELTKVEQYLERSGSRLLALLAANPADRESGLEGILAKWGVRTSANTVVDPDHSPGGGEVVVSAFGVHPVTSPLYGSGLELGRPRAVGRLNLKTQAPDAPRVQVIAETCEKGHFEGDEVNKRQFPVMVAVEKSLQGVASDRGPTRMLIVGDSLCLANNCMSGPWVNRNFAVCAVNWLLDRTPLIQIGPHPVNEYTLRMTKAQLQSAELVLVAGMPGGILFLGVLVWLRRRR
jgi:hypothetical protein